MNIIINTQKKVPLNHPAHIKHNQNKMTLFLITFTNGNSHKTLGVPQLPVRVDDLLPRLKPVTTPGAGHSVEGHAVQAVGGQEVKLILAYIQREIPEK